jgi:hypothetical protein
VVGNITTFESLLRGSSGSCALVPNGEGDGLGAVVATTLGVARLGVGTGGGVVALGALVPPHPASPIPRIKSPAAVLVCMPVPIDAPSLLRSPGYTRAASFGDGPVGRDA